MTYDINLLYLILYHVFIELLNDILMTQKRHINDILMT